MPGEYSQKQLHARFDAIVQRFDRIEEYLQSIGEAVGKPYRTYADSLNLSPEVLALLRDGKRLEAAAAYRKATGASMDDTEQAFAGL